mmetsp:Transcript_26878/g.43257  ORF Transcript_26878/g.43257 Transcript_26878/m.43257 type:complete len:239 (-) Transcript_26878:421-1137(-)
MDKTARRSLIARALEARKSSALRTRALRSNNHKQGRRPDQQAKPSVQSLEDSKKYRGYCEVCFSKRKWCGFNHLSGNFEKGGQSRKLSKQHDARIMLLRRALVKQLDPTVKILFFKLYARLEKHFKFNPIHKANDPRDINSKPLTQQAVYKRFYDLGISLEREEISLLFQTLGKDVRDSSCAITKEDLVCLCVAARCFPHDVTLSFCANYNDEALLSIPLDRWHHDLKKRQVLRNRFE